MSTFHEIDISRLIPCDEDEFEMNLGEKCVVIAENFFFEVGEIVFFRDEMGAPLFCRTPLDEGRPLDWSIVARLPHEHSYKLGFEDGMKAALKDRGII